MMNARCFIVQWGYGSCYVSPTTIPTAEAEEEEEGEDSALHTLILFDIWFLLLFIF
jgi:hypothetical protein